MRVEETFTVGAGFDTVWELVNRVDVIAGCLPGAELTGEPEPGKHLGIITVKFGPTKVRWNGQLELAADKSARTIVVDARGKDQRGQSQAKARIELALTPAGPASTELHVGSDVSISGVLGAFANSGGEPILRSIMADFRANFSAYVDGLDAGGDGEPPAPEVVPHAGGIKVTRHLWRALLDGLRRRFGRREAKHSSGS